MNENADPTDRLDALAAVRDREVIADVGYRVDGQPATGQVETFDALWTAGLIAGPHGCARNAPGTAGRMRLTRAGKQALKEAGR